MKSIDSTHNKNNPNYKMPFPMSFALLGMHLARKYHSTPVFQKPNILRKIYFLRFSVYAAFGTTILVTNYKRILEATRNSFS